MTRFILTLAVFLIAAGDFGITLPATAAGPVDTAAALAQGLQDDARVLRNGVRSGAPAVVLTHVTSRMDADLRQLTRLHAAWSHSLGAAGRTRAASELETIDAGCKRLAALIGELSSAVVDGPRDGGRLLQLSRAVGEQAGLCEKALHDARRAAGGPGQVR